ncbi:MAG: trehalose-6-phosphate synthase [Omnitrophica bacterium]|nr:trehalose-6-phosphate synthase [Candidatus Omnitrophota bacterium]
MLWTKQSLKDRIQDIIGDRMLIIASNREPYVHIHKEGKIEYIQPVGGAVTALDPVMKVCKGTWVAYGSGNADKEVVDKKNEVGVPPDNPKYKLRRIWLNKDEENGYYYGYSNKAMWPLCHMAYTRPAFDEVDWAYYKIVNKKFADTILNVVGNKKAFVWIQDYHLLLLGKLLKEKNKNLLTAHFLHIPWPNTEAFRICPQKREILKGLLANDLLGFHIRYHCANFMETVKLEMEARVDTEKTSVTYGGHEVFIRAFPISVDFEEISDAAQSKDTAKAVKKLKDEFSINDGLFVMAGLDRIDYTKGIIEKVRAVDRFFEKFPEYKGKVLFIQKGGLSRMHIPEYKNLNEELNGLVEEVNWKHSTEKWAPILFIRKHMTRKEIIALYKIADACIVSPVHDGMNLVCKEYIAAKKDLNGALILSRFTGAARELDGAIFVNPYSREDFARAIKKAIELPRAEKQKRMRRLRSVVKENNIYKWAGKFLEELKRI